MKQASNNLNKYHQISVTRVELLAIAGTLKNRIEGMKRANDRAVASSFESSSHEPDGLPYSHTQFLFWERLLWTVVHRLNQIPSDTDK